MNLLILLFIAHLLGDFIFQPKSWVDQRASKKIRSPLLYVHVAIHFVLVLLVMLLLRKPDALLFALIISGSHLAIDIVKAYWGKGKIWFFIDQLLHILVISGVWYFIEKPHIYYSFFYDNNVLLMALALLFVTKPASIIVKTIVSKWDVMPPGGATSSNGDSLDNAGEYIGIIERFLVIIFILVNQWSAIGFLIAAKSVFRFGDLRRATDRKRTEYVLIGTLLSFGIAILAGIIIAYYITNVHYCSINIYTKNCGRIAIA